MNIRPMQAMDIPVCARIMVENVLWQRYGVSLEKAVQRFSDGLQGGESIAVVELEHQVIGFIWFVLRGAFHRSGYIMLIGVSPKAQGSGAGGALMEYAEEILFQTSNDVFLLVSDFNLAAQRFYQGRGYQQVGAIPDYVLPNITELIYRKTRPI